MVASDKACCELLHLNSLALLEILGWLIDVKLAIVYLPTNLFIKKKKKILPFLRSTTKIFKYFRQVKK